MDSLQVWHTWLYIVGTIGTILLAGWALYLLWSGLVTLILALTKPDQPTPYFSGRSRFSQLWQPQGGLVFADWPKLYHAAHSYLGSCVIYLRGNVRQPPTDFGLDGNIYRLFIDIPGELAIRLKWYNGPAGWKLVEVKQGDHRIDPRLSTGLMPFDQVLAQLRKA